jgi:hypothetical protein
MQASEERCSAEGLVLSDYARRADDAATAVRERADFARAAVLCSQPTVSRHAARSQSLRPPPASDRSARKETPRIGWNRPGRAARVRDANK